PPCRAGCAAAGTDRWRSAPTPGRESSPRRREHPTRSLPRRHDPSLPHQPEATHPASPEARERPRPSAPCLHSPDLNAGSIYTKRTKYTVGLHGLGQWPALVGMLILPGVAGSESWLIRIKLSLESMRMKLWGCCSRRSPLTLHRVERAKCVLRSFSRDSWKAAAYPSTSCKQPRADRIWSQG